MPSIFQRSLAGGKVANQLLPRMDTSKVASGLREMKNFWATRSGSAQNRPGLRFVQECKDAHDDLRIEKFHFNDAQAYAMEIGTKYLRFYQFAEGEPLPLAIDGDDGTASVETLYQTRRLTPEADTYNAGTLFGGVFGDGGISEAKNGMMARIVDENIPTTRGIRAGGSNAVQTSWTFPAGSTPASGVWEDSGSTVSFEISNIASGGNSPAWNDVRAYIARVDAGFTTVLQSGSLSPSGVTLNEGDEGVYEFEIPATTWTSTDATDRLVLLLNATHGGGLNTHDLDVLCGAGAESFVTTSITEQTEGVLPWNEQDAILTGEVRYTDALVAAPATLYLSPTVPSPTPTGGFGTVMPGGDPYGSIDETMPAADEMGVVTNSVSPSDRSQVFVTAADYPGWSQWPDAGSEYYVGLLFNDIVGTSLFVSATVARFDEDNVLQELGTESASVDLVALGVGPHVITCTAPSAGWSSGALSTDRFGVVLRYWRTSAGTSTADLEVGGADTYVTTPAIYDSAGGFDFYYAVADHTGKDPTLVQYQDDFWYVEPENADGNALLEVPTPYAQADLDELQFVQAGNVITITHRDYPPYELVRRPHDQMTFGWWTMLPIAFKPVQAAPTAFVNVDGGIAGSKRIQYKVTAINKDTGAESNPGGGGTMAAGGVNAISAVVTGAVVTNETSTTLDLSVADTSHGLVTGDEVFILDVDTADADRGNQVAIEALKGTVQIIDRTDADNFTLRGTAGLLTFPAISDPDSYPEITVDYTHAYVQYTGAKPPKADTGQRIEFSWTAASGASEYFVYRRILDESAATDEGDEAWGFLDSTNGVSFADVGEDTASGVIVSSTDEETPPPIYNNPFVYNQWPRCSAYHQQRQWFAGSNDNPRRCYGSRTGDFRSFSKHSPLQDDDAIQFDIAAEEANEIVSLSTLGRFTIFTTGAIWAATGNDAGVIIPSAIGLESVSYEGSTDIRPEPVDDSLLYVQARGSILREMAYDVGGGGFAGYAGRDLTLFSPKLFDGYQITDIARATIPHQIVWMVRDDGVLLGLTILKEQDVLAWHEHTTDGSVISMATVPEQNEDVLYAIVKRTIESVDRYYVERMDVRSVGRANTDNRITSFFVDSGVTYNGTNTGVITLTLTGGSTWAAGETGLTLTASDALFVAGDAAAGVGWRLVGSDGLEVECDVTADSSTTVVTVTLLTSAPASTQGIATASWVKMLEDIDGLDHLEGEAVAVLADSNVITGMTVASGAIELARPYGIVHVGLAIPDADLELLDVDLLADRDTLAHKNKRVPRTSLFVENTRGIVVGPADGTGLYPMQLEHGDSALDLITDKRTFNTETTYTTHGRILIRQTLPLPAEITGVIRHVEFGDK